MNEPTTYVTADYDTGGALSTITVNLAGASSIDEVGAVVRMLAEAPVNKATQRDFGVGSTRVILTPNNQVPVPDNRPPDPLDTSVPINQLWSNGR